VKTVNGQLAEVPNTDCENPLPVQLNVTVTATSSYGNFTCFNNTGVLTFKTPISGGTNCWQGRISGSCTDCNGATFSYVYDIVLCCRNVDNEYTISMVPVETTCPAETLTETAGATTCDPFLISGCWSTFGGCFVGCLDGTDPIPSPSFTVCFEIYEVP